MHSIYNNHFNRFLKAETLFILMACFMVSNTFAQADFFAPAPKYNPQRLTGVVITESVIGVATTIGLNYLWYKKFPHSRFHLFNDNNEWLGMDKVGHATTAYNIAAIESDIMHWCGVKKGPAALIGTATALGFMTMVEILDGHSAAWGFSKGDMLANISGCLLFGGQELLWGQQRMSLKYSYHHTIYSKYNPAELGSNTPQRMLKDYNGQTYWLSANIASFLPAAANFPKWLNISAGYGAEGMTGASKNPLEVNGHSIPAFKRYRQFYLAPDADLYRIDNISPLASTLFKLNRTVKMVAPTIEWNEIQHLRFHWLYY
jgi:uncharacterized protein YfiM (DUF2279 family)